MPVQTAVSEEHLPHYRVRPRFRHHCSNSSRQLTDLLQKALSAPKARIKGRVLDEHYACLRLPEADQHYWSPQLSLSFEDLEDGTLIRGMYGPRPAVWTMFVFIYFCIAAAAVVITIIGLSRLYLEQSGAILWLVPLLLLLFCTLYLVAYLGQKTGHEQMAVLHHFLEESTGLEIIGDASSSS